MKRRVRIRPALLIFCAALLVSLMACQKKQAPKPEEAEEHVGPSPLGTSQPVLNKVFTVRTAMVFPFEIPARAAMPRLHGDYKSFIGKVGSKPDGAANVDFLVLTAEQYADFASGTGSAALFSADAAHEQTVDVSLPPSMNEPQKFYVVFRNTAGGDAKKVVQADLSVDF